jgi:hypothetical protein
VGILEGLNNEAKVVSTLGGQFVVLSQKMLKLPQLKVSTYSLINRLQSKHNQMIAPT